MKKIAYIICFLFSIALFFAFYQVEDKEVMSVKTPAIKKEVTVIQLKKENYEEYVTTYGEIQNDDQVKLSFQMGGKVTRLNVEEGQYVKKGQVLAELDNTQQQNSTQQLLVEKDKISYSLNSLHLEKESYTKNLKSISDLYRDGVATLEEKENAQLQLDLVRNNINALDESLKSIDKKLELSNFNTNLFVLTAPQNGTIEKTFITKNENVGVGQEVIHFSPSGKNAVVELNLTAQEVSQIEKGYTVKIHVDYPKKKVYQGKVKSISYYRDERQSDYSVIIDFNSTKDRLIYGSLVKVEISTATKHEGYKIPFDAIENVKDNTIEILTISKDSTIHKAYFTYQKVNNQHVLIDNATPEKLDVIIDKSIGIKEFDKAQLISYKKAEDIQSSLENAL